MSITIETDYAGQIWRYVNGVQQEELILCHEAEVLVQSLRRYGDAYPGERWETPGIVIRPEHVPWLYLAPPVITHLPPIVPANWHVVGDASSFHSDRTCAPVMLPDAEGT